MPKIGAKQAAEQTQQVDRFFIKYALNKVGGLHKPGDKCFILLINPEENVFQNQIHTVKAKSNDIGFHGKFSRNIVCKTKLDEAGNAIETGVCCDLYAQEKEKYPTKEESTKRMISYSKPIYHIPVVVLGNNLTDKSKSGTIGQVSVKSYDYAIFELQKTTWSKTILGALGSYLVDEEIIDGSLDKPEILQEAYENLGNVIIEIKAVESDGFAAFTKEYKFHHFTSNKIAKQTGEYDNIVNWTISPDMSSFRNDAFDFVKLMEQHEGELILTEWSDADLLTYINEDKKKKEDLEAFKRAQKQKEEEYEECVIVKKQSINKVQEDPSEGIIADDPIIYEDDYEFNEEEGFIPED